jgi:hypothetical protein
MSYNLTTLVVILQRLAIWDLPGLNPPAILFVALWCPLDHA